MPHAGPIALVLPGVDFGHGADGAGFEVLAQQADAVAAMTLVAHLRHDFVIAGFVLQDAAFVDVVGQRLFAIDVLPARMAATEAAAWVWSGVATKTALILPPNSSNILRKS